MRAYPVYHTIDGPIVMIGFGSIGKGTLPLIERHFRFDKERFTVIDPDDSDRAILDEHGVSFLHVAITKQNYRDVLTPLLKKGGGRPFIVNLSVDVSSTAMIAFAQEMGALYIDTVVEPWLGGYFDTSLTMAQRTNYAMRETVLELKRGQVDRCVMLWRKPGDGLLVCEEGDHGYRARHRPADSQANDARGLGPAHAQARRQGRAYCRA
jgi:homospermidine synthase